MTLGQKIKISRQKALLSQEEFAKELNVSVVTINRWETGKSKPNISGMKSLKSFCERNGLEYSDIEHDWIVGLEGDSNE
ncbi:MAG: helix-turn-helix transcriptional regulator [Methanocorpusculum parvum]|nr:helix-turn-helix transcriptional regulator [Methanocorpusculum parvum]